jgi:hypothetical protein
MVDIEPSTDSLCFDGENRSQLDDSVTPFSLFTCNLGCRNEAAWTDGDFTINLSQHNLTTTEKTLLDKGLTFIPTQKLYPSTQLFLLQHRLIRQIKLQDFFNLRHPDDTDFDRIPFQHPSTWIPPDRKISSATHKLIGDIITFTDNALSNRVTLDGTMIHLRNNTDNLSQLERDTLKSLSLNPLIEIKPADKGSATVIMDKSAYLSEAYRQLNNTLFYKRISEPQFTKNVPLINEVLMDMLSLGVISERQFAYLHADTSDRSRRFYLLPKIHKPKHTWPQPNTMPEGRPIVSDSSSESYRVSQLIDSYLKPISKEHFSYIKDSYDFVTKVQGKPLPDSALFVTGDVTSLYTNMRFDRIISTVKSALDRTSHDPRLCASILKLLELTLKGNDFEFNDEYFLQICGTAMGKVYAPSLADIYLEEFDTSAQQNFLLHPELYFRFIDDMHFIWLYGVETLLQFQEFLNSLIPQIKITLTWSHTTISFLDVQLYRQHTPTGDTIGTRVHFKPTDTHQLLYRTSFHPAHTFKGIVKSQFIRFKRLSSQRTDYDLASSILMRALHKRKYNKRLLRRLKLEVWQNPAYSLQHIRTPSNTKIFPIIVPHNDLGRTLSRGWRNILSQTPLLNTRKLITAYTVAKNLSRHLVRSTFTKKPKRMPPHTRQHHSLPHSSKPCHHSRCQHCKYLNSTSTFSSSLTNQQFRVRGTITCATRNVIYLITCKKCSKQYVGETGIPVRSRLALHLSDIRLRKPTAVSLHFNSLGHSTSHVSLTGIELLRPGTCPQYRRVRESTWQTLLHTKHPDGINNLQ